MLILHPYPILDFARATCIAIPSCCWALPCCRYGDLLWKRAFSLHTGAGKWNDVAVRVRMNTLDSSCGAPRFDGLLAVTVNGVTESFDKLVWRTEPEFHVNAMLFSTFFGGSTPDWATPADTWTYFRNISLEKRG